MKTLPGRDVPDFDGGVGIAGNEDVVAEFHAGGQRLVTHEGMLAGPRFDVPDANGGVERTADNVNTVELEESFFCYDAHLNDFLDYSGLSIQSSKTFWGLYTTTN